MAVVAAEGGEDLPQPVGVGEAAQMVDAREVGAGDVEAAGFGAGGQEQFVVAHGGAVAEVDAAGVAVDAGDGLAEVELDPVLGVPGGVVDVDAVAFLLAGQIALGQRGAFVGVVSLVPDDDHSAGESVGAEGFRGLRPGQPAADDDECPMCVDHLMPPRYAAAICERPARSVMAKGGGSTGMVPA